MTDSPYARPPLHHQEGIPVFSESSPYVVNYQQIAKDHSDHFHQTGGNPFISEQLWQESEQSTADLIRAYARPGERILDVGVGMGRVLSGFPELVRFGMDISFDYLTMARSKGIEVCFARIEDMPYAPESFDLVVCTDVLEHVFDLYDCTRKILSVLRPDGVLIVRVPYKEDLSAYLDPASPYEYVHLRTFDEASLRLHFEKIFACETLQTRRAGYVHSQDRLVWRFPGIGRALLKGLSLIRRTRPKTYASLRERMFEAIEINMVFRKVSPSP
ncbi:MAG: class I SAM-dependent methyltransferase [Candidatus Sericytochromatia bacterium]